MYDGCVDPLDDPLVIAGLRKSDAPATAGQLSQSSTDDVQLSRSSALARCGAESLSRSSATRRRAEALAKSTVTSHNKSHTRKRS